MQNTLAKTNGEDAHEIHDMEEEDLRITDGFDADLMDDDEDEGELEIVDDGSKQSEQTNKFDRIIGVLEEIIMEDEFEDQKNAFCKEHCKHFEDTDENKLIYTQLFEQYTHMIETAIEQKLDSSVEGFDMQEFMEQLEARKDEIMSEEFDLLLSLADFQTFKEVMLAYKADAQHSQTGGLSISCHAMHIHVEEQEDGDERPDLDFSLQVSPLSKAP